MPFGWGKGHQRVNSDALDSDTLAEADAWLGRDESEWVANGAELVALEAEAHFYLDAEQHICNHLHKRPQQPKGDRSGRARSKGERHSRS